MYGWCQTKNHTECPHKQQRFIIVKSKVTMLDEWTECDCVCHRPRNSGKKSKTRKKKSEPTQ